MTQKLKIVQQQPVLANNTAQQLVCDLPETVIGRITEIADHQSLSQAQVLGLLVTLALQHYDLRQLNQDKININ